MLGITASPQEYDDYVELLIKNPRLGHTYKAYFGDIYQLDARLLPQFDYVSLFHVGEFRTPENDAYGALTDLEMTLILADKTQARRRDAVLFGLVRLRQGRGRRQGARANAAVRGRRYKPAHLPQARLRIVQEAGAGR